MPGSVAALRGLRGLDRGPDAAGVTGLSMLSMPNGCSASSTALTTAAAEAMVPASPHPFTPSGFTGEGVTVHAVSTCGTCVAFGKA